MLEDFHAQPARDRVIVALDCNAATALCLAVQLRGHAKWLKVGMTLYYDGSWAPWCGSRCVRA